MDQTSTTRTELLMRKAQIALGRQGAQLLRGKREALVREFIAELRTFSAARGKLAQALRDATHSLMKSLAVDGPEALASAALACRRHVEVELVEESIWGTKVANLTTDYTVRSGAGRGLPAGGCSIRIAETADEFEIVVGLILEIAPVECKLRKLADEIRKTSRRVNGLEQRLLPRLQYEMRFIRNALEEREREDIFRLKRLKQKRTRGAVTSATG